MCIQMRGRRTELEQSDTYIMFAVCEAASASEKLSFALKWKRISVQRDNNSRRRVV